MSFWSSSRRSAVSRVPSSSNVIKCGTLLKRRTRTGLYVRRWVELRAGFLYWWKLDNLGNRTLCSSRYLPGCSIQGDSNFEKDGQFVGKVTIFIATAPGSKCAPLLFSFENETEYSSWLSAFREAASWQLMRKLRCPFRLMGVLVIEAVRGEGLKVADWGGTSDPYLIVEFDGLIVRSRTIYKTLDPDWSEVLVMPIYHDDPNWSVGIYAYDEDEVSADDLLGIVCLPLHAFGFNEEKIFRLPLLNEHPKAGANAQHGNLGHITFRSYFSTSLLYQALPITKRMQPKTKINTVAVFNIEMFKLQIARITHIAKLLSSLGKVKDIISWRHPYVTLFTYLGMSTIILVYTDMCLFCLIFALLALVIHNHPEYPNLYKRLLRPLGFTFLAAAKSAKPAAADTAQKSSQREAVALTVQKSMIASERDDNAMLTIQQVPSDVEVVDSTSEDEDLFAKEIIQVYECERRNVSATASALISREISSSSFKKTFSARNLSNGEHRWMQMNGTAYEDTPKTVENGLKYVWRVRIDGKITDVNGWEYSLRWPSKPAKWVTNFTKNFHVHMHWVRRRLWIGQAVREATEEDPVRPIGDEDGAEHEMDDLDEVKTPSTIGIIAKYRKIIEEGGKIQYIIHDVVNGIEAPLNFFMWRHPVITKFLVVGLSVGFLVSAFVAPSKLLWVALTGVIGEQFELFLMRQKIVRSFLEQFREEVRIDRRIPEECREVLLRATSFTPVQTLTDHTSLNMDTIRVLLQKTSETLNMHAKLSLKDFADCLYLGEFVERVYRQTLGDRWVFVQSKKAGNIKLNPKFLLQSHAIHNWDKFNLFSCNRTN